MKKIVSFTLGIFLINVGIAQTTLDKTMQHGGLTRTYKIHIPSSYDGSVDFPLVINLHGRLSTSQQQMAYTDFNKIADTANFIVCYPQGTIEPGLTTAYWNIIPNSNPSVNDVDFIVKLAEEIASNYSINTRKTYVCGMSNGGYLAYKLACETNKFAAIASVTGSMIVPYYCSTQPPIPIMQIHGTADPVVNYNGFIGSEGIEALVEFWVNKNQCIIHPTVEYVPDIAVDGTNTVHYTYPGGINGNTVEFYKVINGGHTWPGGTVTIGVTSQDFNASKEIWRFFSQFEKSTIGIPENESIEIIIFPNPVEDVLQIQIPEEIKEGKITLFDITGKQCSQSTTTQKSINVAHYPAGIYFIKLESAHFSTTQKWIKR